MAKASHRVFALVLAILFFGTSVATGVAVVMQINKDKENQKMLTELMDKQKNPASSDLCGNGEPESAGIEPLPETYKTEDDIKELQTKDIKEGDGKEAKPGECLVVKYHGTLAKSGEKFDGNFDKDTTFEFKLGSGNVIQGWEQGLVGMKEGGVRRLVIPSDMAYGENGSGESIPPNSSLVFVVKLIRIK